MNDLRERLAAARLYLVCGAEPDEFLHAALRGGVDIVQQRVKDADDSFILAAAARFRAVCDQHRALFILNDRPDLAAQAGADGVHVGQDDMSVDAARQLVGPSRLIGLSTHTREQVDAAAADPEVDYTGVGPVFATPTKPGRPAVGFELVAYAAAHAVKPWFAIGGLDVAGARAVSGAGATRVAVVRALTEAADPERAAQSLLAALEVPVGST